VDVNTQRQLLVLKSVQPTVPRGRFNVRDIGSLWITRSVFKDVQLQALCDEQLHGISIEMRNFIVKG